jgi:hypothetical protein
MGKAFQAEGAANIKGVLSSGIAKAQEEAYAAGAEQTGR